MTDDDSVDILISYLRLYSAFIVRNLILDIFESKNNN
jgi:hypothetical protein